MFSIRIHHGGKFRRYPGRMYVNGHVDIFDMVDIDLFTVVGLNMMVVQLGYTGESELLFYNYLRPLTSLDEGLYSLACEEDVRCLATLVRSFKLIEVYIEHGVTALDSYNRAPRFKATIEDITDEPGVDTQDHVLPTIQSQFSDINLSFVSQQATPSQVIEDVMRQLSFEETELDGEAGFGDVAGSGVESSGLSHDESFGVDNLDLNLSKPVDLNEPIVKEVRTQEPIMEKVRTQEPIMKDVIVEDYVSSGEDDEQGIDTAYDTQYDVHSSEDASIDDDEDDDDFCHLIISDECFLEGEDMDVINADNFDSDTGNADETSNYRRRRVYMHFIESRRNLKMYKNDSVRVRARSDGKVLVFTMSQGTGPTGLNHGIEAGPSGSSGLSTRSKKKEEYRACIRDLLGLDGAFMKGSFPGQVLAAVRLDSNNVIYPLVYALVELKVRVHGAGSDSGIIPAIKTVFPSAEHKYCLRHIHENMKQGWCGQAYKDLLWRSASATSVKEFEKCMLELKKMNPKAHEWLNKIPPEHWARSHFSGRAKSNLLFNNICEVFNGKIVGGRDKPVITLLEYIREYCMKRIVNVQSVIDKLLVL
ncbi:hypothetical protein Tco_1067561 [Tanacetum coccineum]|uniref:PB1-like domain-containing protein n=1 Tax=Tanacetum coccineum TaxID=301880 RepID=A0ABQ5HEH9_9ASTR